MSSPQQATPALPAGWEAAFDHGSGHWYYFNRATGQRSWTLPQAGSHDATAAAGGAATGVPEAQAAGVDPVGVHAQGGALRAEPGPVAAEVALGGSGSGGGWYYRDPHGALRGPFTRAQLLSWRRFLPMDLALWHVELPLGEQQGRPGGAAACGYEVGKGEGEAGGARRRGGDEEGEGQGPAAAVDGQVGVRTGQEEQQPGGPGEKRGWVLEDSGDEEREGCRGKAWHDQGNEGGLGGADGGEGGNGLRQGEGGGEGEGQQGQANGSRDGGLEQQPQEVEGEDTGEEGPAQRAAKRARRQESPSAAGTGQPADSPQLPEGAEGGAGGLPTAHAGDGSGGAGPCSQGAASGGGGEGGGGCPASAEEAVAAGLPGTTLADVLGDGHLLADWRSRRQEALGQEAKGVGVGGGEGVGAPPAPVHEQWLQGAAAAAAAAHMQYGYHAYPYPYPYQQHYPGQHYPGAGGTGAAMGAGEAEGADGGGGGGAPASRESRMMEYAAAVLEGLPPDDEAVLLARQAAAAGRSLMDVVGFSWAASAGRSSHDAGGPVDEHGAPTQYVRDPRSGRLTAVGAVGGGPQSDSEKRKLYGDYGGWVNPDELDDYLARAKRWRQEELPLLWAKSNKAKEQKAAKAKAKGAGKG